MRNRLPKQKYELIRLARKVVHGEMDHLDSGSVENLKSALNEVRFHPAGRRALDRLSRLQHNLTPSCS
jgi:hypothetical protein